MTSEWGSGIWVIALVLAFNMTCIPLWFLVGHLRRTAEFQRKRLETFLFLLQERPVWIEEEDEELKAVVAELQGHLEQAENLGPIWGKKHTTLAKLLMTRVCDLHPEDAAIIWSKMER